MSWERKLTTIRPKFLMPYSSYFMSLFTPYVIVVHFCMNINSLESMVIAEYVVLYFIVYYSHIQNIMAESNTCKCK